VEVQQAVADGPRGDKRGSMSGWDLRQV